MRRVRPAAAPSFPLQQVAPEEASNRVPMKRFVAAALAGMLLGALAPSARTDTATLDLVRVEVTSPEQASYLMGHFDETHNHSSTEIELLLWPGDRAELDALGYSYRVVQENLPQHELQEGTRAPAPIALPGPDYDDYRRLGDYNSEMETLAEKNPKSVKLFEMARPSLEGRTVLGLEIAADVKSNDGRPIFYMDALHHAREWPASEYTMIFAHHLVEKYGKDRRITSLLKKARVILVPIVNPDGFDYSRESVLSLTQGTRNAGSSTAGFNGFEGYWRKNRRSLTGATVPVAQKNPDAFGVDPNRNYAYLWGDGNGGSSGDQTDQTYRGTAPFSEPETQNVRDIVLSRTITGIITNHTYQATVLRTGGGNAPDDHLLSPIADRLAAPMNYRNQASVGYPTTGTTDDWAYSVAGILGFTIEHGSEGFHPAYVTAMARVDGVMEAFTRALEVAANERYHSVISGKVIGGSGAKATLKKTFQTVLSDGNPTGEKSFKETISIPLKVNKDGSFEFHVGPSSRPWEKKPESYKLVIKSGGKTKTITVRVDRGETARLGTIRL